MVFWLGQLDICACWIQRLLPNLSTPSRHIDFLTNTNFNLVAWALPQAQPVPMEPYVGPKFSFWAWEGKSLRFLLSPVLTYHRSGKTSILQVLFDDLPVKQTFYLEPTMRVAKHFIECALVHDFCSCLALNIVSQHRHPVGDMGLSRKHYRRHTGRISRRFLNYSLRHRHPSTCAASIRWLPSSLWCTGSLPTSRLKARRVHSRCMPNKPGHKFWSIRA